MLDMPHPEIEDLLEPGTVLDEHDRALLADVEHSLTKGVALAKWWEAVDRQDAYRDRFELTQVYHRPETGFSFFDVADMPGGALPVMGDVPDVFYDRPKEGTDLDTWTAEVGRFALRHFMRVSDFRLPEVVEDDAHKSDRGLRSVLGMCPRGYVRREGFGFRQLFYRRRDTGAIGRFPDQDRYAIVDTQELEERYDWVVMAVRIFDFDLSYPIDPKWPRLSAPMNRTAYVVLSSDFTTVEENPEPGVRARFAFGYAMLNRSSKGKVLVYGPGHFSAGFQIFAFDVLDRGEVRVRMPFVVNRPDRILDVPLNPLQWGRLLGERVAPEAMKRAAAPLFALAERLPNPTFDPMFTGIRLLDRMTFGFAERELCISVEQLEKSMLIFHFEHYYAMITGSLVTWRLIPNWLAEDDELPDWALSGRST